MCMWTLLLMMDCKIKRILGMLICTLFGKKVVEVTEFYLPNQKKTYPPYMWGIVQHECEVMRNNVIVYYIDEGCEHRAQIVMINRKSFFTIDEKIYYYVA